MVDRTLRIAVVSDIHAGRSSDVDTYVFAKPGALRHQDPLKDLIEDAREGKISADWLVFAGDLSNRSYTQAKQWGWARLQELKKALGAQRLIATPGNHDMNVQEHGEPIAAALLDLTPGFPSGEDDLDDRFWNEGFYVDDRDPDVRVLNVNSCFDFPPPPGPSPTKRELTAHMALVSRGSITAERIEAIERDLRDREQRSVNIAVLHHHPVEHELREAFQDYHGAMSNGGDLLEMLKSMDPLGRWLVIHGHKHLPSHSVVGPDSRSPILLCAGSVGGVLWRKVNTVYRNLFHLVDLDIGGDANLPPLRGRIRTVEWGFGKGWDEAEPRAAFPGTFGFGVTTDFEVLGRELLNHLETNGPSRWTDVEALHPHIKYISYRDMRGVSEYLNQRGWSIDREFAGRGITSIVRKVN